jgi:alcohol dehydrogenase
MDTLLDAPAAAARVFRFFLPEIICGWGALAEAGRTARRLGARRVLLVTQPDPVEAGWAARLHRYLAQAGLEHVTWDGVSTDPRDVEVVAALEAYRRRDCDVVVGLGGRGAMDAAKAVAVLSTNGGSLADYDGFDRVTQPTPPTVLIPTAIGSGAEVLQSCAIRDTARRRTVTMLGCALAADVSLVDPAILGTLPPQAVAAGGFDALAMAIEAYLGLATTALTEPHALAAVRLIGDHLVRAVDAPGDPAEATALATAGVHAGVAFADTFPSAVDRLCGLLADLVDLPRGIVKGVLLPHVIRRGSVRAAHRCRAVADALRLDTAGLPDDWVAHAVAAHVRAAGDKIGIPGGLAELGVGPDAVESLALATTQDPATGADVRTASYESVSAVLHAAL